MAKGLNSITIGGNTGRDAELSFTAGGQAISKFSLAVSEGFGDKERTMWVNVVAFGKLAESLNPYITKGAKIGVQGRLSLRDYEKDGIKKQAAEVIANDIWLAGRSGDAPQTPERAAPAAAPRRQSRSAAPVPADENVDESDIPF